MYGSTAVGVLFFLVVPTWLLASDQVDLPKVAKSDAPKMAIENVRIVGEHVFPPPDASSDTGYMNPDGATISFDLVNRGETEVAASQLENHTVVQQWIEPVEELPISCTPSKRPIKKRAPAGGWTIGKTFGPGFPRFPPTMKPGASVGVELPLYPIAEYCLHGRYAYYLYLQDREGHVRDEYRIDIEATCPGHGCTVRQLQGPAPKPR